jgi:uracil-DNA glycosylase family 4
MSRVTLPQLAAQVAACRACERLVAWREQVAHDRRAAFREQNYWGRPVPGFGDPAARLLVVGLAPAAHGANRTGRLFTGDRSGDWLYGALYRAGYSNQPTSVSRDDGLRLSDCYVTACVRCCPPQNKPTPQERDHCLPFLARELRLLRRVRCILCLGGFAWKGALAALATVGPAVRPQPRFGHGSEARVGPYFLIGSYHPSQQNTFTGRLTEAMLDAVLARARAVAQSSAGKPT